MWGEHRLPRVCSYRYLVLILHVMKHGMSTLKMIDSGRTKLNQLHSVISIRSINLSARRIVRWM